MIQINIADAKAHLSEYLERVRAGETVVICNRNVPFAEIRRLRERSSDRRKFGGFKDQVRIHPGFFEPLAEDELDQWGGGSR